MLLHNFLRDIARLPLVWGERDCALTVADWWRLNHGTDPAADIRGTYANEAECRALLARQGGLLRLMARRARACGAELTYMPVAGDIGVVRCAGDHVAMICTGPDEWAGRGATGLTVIKGMRPVRAWRI